MKKRGYYGRSDRGREETQKRGEMRRGRGERTGQALIEKRGDLGNWEDRHKKSGQERHNCLLKNNKN